MRVAHATCARHALVARMPVTHAGRMASSQVIAVLGLGRMGAAMAARLVSLGCKVTGWTRSGRRVDAVDMAGDPADAVASADVVILALFDGPACAQVLDRVRSALRPGTIVVNTSTIAPAEAAALAGQLGTSYVHAPVLGSLPAVAEGQLKILAGVGAASLARDRPLLDTLEALGEVRPVGDAATAAALKLVANSSLAGAVLALRDSLSQGSALGLPRPQVLDVLALGPLGALVDRKRSFLDGKPTPAEFTIGALAKDMALLADASHSPLRSAAELAGSPAGQEADIALAATTPAPGDDVLIPLRAYIRGHASGDPAHFREAFLPTAHIEGMRDGAFVSWSLDDYCALFSGRPAADEPGRRRRIDAVDIHGTVAMASMTLRHGPDTFTDIFLLVHDGSQWRIANKAYHRHREPARTANHVADSPEDPTPR
ncbi:MAG TPA: nuclear transport factor 2 family protein [Acetobacteraceae bacterium]|nr:nuclear transport factor 2 family protein [Acetobacteraceae bacterium]